MAHLEYRLDDAVQNYPALYHYRNISTDELTLRLLCDFYIKQNQVYEHTWSAVEEDVYVIYVTRSAEENLTATLSSPAAIGSVILEVREFFEGQGDYPLIENKEFPAIQELIPYVLAGYRTIQGQVWETSTLEVDEDRSTYVLYVKKPEATQVENLQ
ncbi:MAG: hypothetical protein QMC95_13215 [Desulfitobacteriaceae bacterium]|nr:hypothetical protein [Desulfitobacteriaceae bacterium]MDI6879713.1 hypothetical protein [Desulfitobacteriaceae bacterium]MDI6915158.1 hypothetical protein [Desulfitobacteriaceae bacterium]